jgi:hypothetical protein
MPRRCKAPAAVKGSAASVLLTSHQHQLRFLIPLSLFPQEKRLARQRKGGKDAAPQPEEGAQASDAARIEVLTAQLEAANAKLEESAKRCNYLLLERVSAAGLRC